MQFRHDDERRYNASDSRSADFSDNTLSERRDAFNCESHVRLMIVVSTGIAIVNRRVWCRYCKLHSISTTTNRGERDFEKSLNVMSARETRDVLHYSEDTMRIFSRESRDTRRGKDRLEKS